MYTEKVATIDGVQRKVTLVGDLDEATITRELELFLDDKKYKEKVLEVQFQGKDRLTISFKDMIEYNHALGMNLQYKPHVFFKAAARVVEEVTETPQVDVTVRIKNLTDSFKVRIRDVRAKHLGQFVSVEGQINTVSDVRPMIIRAVFECPNCIEQITRFQFGKAIVFPVMCKCGRKGKFKCIYKEYADVQRLVVEELLETLEGNEQPRKLNIILTKGLTNPELDRYNSPGNKILINGILEEQPKGSEESTEREFIMVANHIEPLEEDFREIEINKEDLEQIKTLSADPEILNKMVKSFAPDIYGHEVIKKAIILQLFGGNNVVHDGRLVRRGMSHVLLIGEPGTAKTKLLKFAALIAPKSRYTSGTGSSGAGLTAAVSRDEFIGGWSLEAGVLVLANGGIACLDELDKIPPEERGKLHEALSEGEVNVNKATIHARLRAETAALAAANPKFGRFDYHQPIPSQIDLEPALLSRFDFIYPVKDRVDEVQDEAIISSMLKLHTGGEEVFEVPMSPELFKKYIVYSRKLPPVQISKSATNAITEIYKNLRKMGMKGTENHVPITARYGEALIRLTVSAAKARLSKIANVEDVEVAREVLMFSLEQLAWDEETGTLDVDRLELGVSTSKRQGMQSILRVMRRITTDTGESLIPYEKIVDAMKATFNLDESTIDELMQKLSSGGEIYQPRSGFWKVM